jgi:hypothetical protein
MAATHLLAAANQEQAELVADQDRLLINAAKKLRTVLASPALSGEQLRQAAQVADEWGALIDRRLEQIAKQAALSARIIAALAQPSGERAIVLRSQAAHLESIALSVTAEAEILEAIAAVKEKLDGR